ncbi:MAG: hypothetical protein U1F63_07695 [Chitinivorax sp.]
MKLKDLQLTDEDHQRLQKLVKYGDDWRERDRAQTILYFAAGWRAKDIAAKQQLNLDTVSKPSWQALGRITGLVFVEGL